jgi:hypothetical protein
MNSETLTLHREKLMRSSQIISKIYTALKLVAVAWILLLCFVFVLLGALVCSSLKHHNERTEQLVLPSGDTLLNESYVLEDWLDVHGGYTMVNELYIFLNGVDKKELVIKTVKIAEENSGLLEGCDNIQLFRDGTKVALVVGPDLFVRGEKDDKSRWHKSWSAGIDWEAAHFIRSISFENEALAKLAAAGDSNQEILRRNHPYQIEDLDLRRNILVIKAKHDQKELPERLVYALSGKYENVWIFDPERTVQMNPSLKRHPFPQNAALELTLVAVRGRFEDIPRNVRNNLSAVLELPGARICERYEIDLSAKQKTVIQTMVNLPSGREIKRPFETMGAGGDQDPEKAAVYWRPPDLNALGTGWRLMRFNEIEFAGIYGYDEGISILSYLRLYRTNSAESSVANH